MNIETIDRMDGLVPQSSLRAFEDAVADITCSFIEEGFEAEEIKEYLNRTSVIKSNDTVIELFAVSVGRQDSAFDKALALLKASLPHVAKSGLPGRIKLFNAGQELVESIEGK